MSNKIPTRLKRILKEEGRTQSWLARKVGVHRNTVLQWMHVYGDHPSDANQRAIADALGRTVDDVFPADTTDSLEQAA